MPEVSSRSDPFSGFRFEVKLDDFSVSSFSECSGLQIEIEFQDYPEGGLNTFVHKLPGRTKQTNLQLKRGIVDRKVWDWFFQLTQGKVVFRSGSIRVLDEGGNSPVMEYQFRNALPCKWLGPSLNATQNSVAVETLELCYEDLERIV